MFGIGDTEFILILIFAFLLFGPDKLPALGKMLGKGVRQFREASNSVTKVVQEEVIAPVQKEARAAAEKPMNSSSKQKAGATNTLEAKGTNAPDAPETFAQRKARLEQEYKEAAKTKEAAKS